MKIKYFTDEGGFAPNKAHKSDAGFDLFTPEDIYLPAYGRVNVDLKLHVEIPEGHVGYLMSRSSLMRDWGVHSGMGVIDSGYTGSISACLFNVSNYNCYFKKGKAVTQLVIAPISDIEEITESTDFKVTERGNNGFGSTNR